MILESLSKQQLLALLGAARAYRQRDWLMCLVAFTHGLRASEVVALTPGCVENGELTVRRLKGSRKTTHPLVAHPEPLLDERQALIDYCAGVPANQKLFPITRERFWQIVQQHGKAAGIPKRLCHPHVFKHTIGTQLAETIPLNKVQRYLGHQSLGSTGKYTEISDAAAANAAQESLQRLID